MKRAYTVVRPEVKRGTLTHAASPEAAAKTLFGSSPLVVPTETGYDVFLPATRYAKPGGEAHLWVGAKEYRAVGAMTSRALGATL